LRNQDNLLYASAGQGADLVVDVDRQAGSLLPANQRDGAERARLVASFCHLDVGIGDRRGGPVDRMENVHRRTTQSNRLPVGEPVQRPDQFAVAVETENRVCFRQSLGDLRSEPLRHATEHHQVGFGLLGLFELEDRLYGFLPGLLNERTGIDHNDVCSGRVGCLGVPRFGQHGGEFLRVDLVLGAAKRG
jgi:hypothetical protein